MKKARNLYKLFALGGLMLVASGMQPHANAQSKNEIGLVIGATLTPSQTLSSGGDLTFKPSLALGAEYDRRVATAKLIAISLGVDFLASPFDVKLDRRPAGEIRQFAYIFLTPHVRAKFNPEGSISPWLSFGGGYARFLETLDTPPGTATTFKKGTNTGTLVFGGGMDTSTLVRVLRIPIGFRFEVRDFYSGLPSYNGTVRADLQHSVALTGGVLLKF